MLENILKANITKTHNFIPYFIAHGKKFTASLCDTSAFHS